jgi:myo-inositol-1(or 4)-monophosphatase
MGPCPSRVTGAARRRFVLTDCIRRPDLNIEDILETTIDIAREAGAVVRGAFPVTALEQIDYKGAVNPVTATDLAAEEVIVRRLRSAFPDHRILAEEGGFVGGEEGDDPSRPFWVIDPIDGTNNFAHGFPHVAVSMAMQLGGETVVGVILDPLRQEVFAATAGGGCTRNGRPAAVTSVTALGDALLAAGFPYNRRTAADNNAARLDHFLRRSMGIRRAGSAALDLAYVACGRLSGYFEIRLSRWDVGAGILLVREAGGRVTDFAGNDDCYSGETVLASNGLIHDQMLRVMAEGAAAPMPY